MKITMQECKHKPVFYVPGHGVANYVFATCSLCYKRIRCHYDDEYADTYTFGSWEEDFPAPFGCEHNIPTMFNTVFNKGKSWIEAQCTSCGVVLRHEDGPGEWEPVIFYGFTIREVP